MADTRPDSDTERDTPEADAEGDLPQADADSDVTDPPGPYVIEDPGHSSETAAQLEEFYRTYGGREAFPAHHVSALEALVFAEDDLVEGAARAASERIESVFAEYPRAEGSWWLGADAGTGGSNVGHPVAYYGLRMLEQVVALSEGTESDALQMTADAQGVVDAVSPEIADATDIWWVISPTATAGEEDEVGRHFIGGGMGLSSDGRPLFLSDDGWFLRKPNHMGTGEWTELELRTYHPQWFQHELMHHLFRTWPEFGLEETRHQWFDRATWPDDFEGTFEPAYYAESIVKRFLDATPSLAEGFRAPEFRGADEWTVEELIGEYRREPVENDWHKVVVSAGTTGDLTWRNSAGVSWELTVVGDQLRTGEDCPYGESEIGVEFSGDRVNGLWSFGEKYARHGR